MLILVAVSLLLVIPLVMTILQLARPKFGYNWLIAAFAALGAWPLLLLARPEQPVLISLQAWSPVMPVAGETTGLTTALLLDPISWSFGLALVTLLLAMILTDVVRTTEASWATWAGSMFLTALGLLAVFSGNSLTLLLAWAAIDVFELVLLLGHHVKDIGNDRVVVAFSVRVLGIIVLMLAGLLAGGDQAAANGVLDFQAIPPQAPPLLILAAGLRLGILPLHLHLLGEPSMRRGLGTLLRLAPAATSLALLARTAQASADGAAAQALGGPATGTLLLALAGLAALYGGLAWAVAGDELSERPSWILGMASLAMAAAVQGQPAASLAWGLALLLPGGMLFLASARPGRLRLLMLAGAIGLLALPYTPAWWGVGLYSAGATPLAVIFLVAQALLTAGFLRHSLRAQPLTSELEWWVRHSPGRPIYPWGLSLLPLAHFVIAARGLPEVAGGAGRFPSLAQSWPAAAGLAIIALLWAVTRRGLHLPVPLARLARTLVSFGWLYRLIWLVYGGLGRALHFTEDIFEGEGGILWALLWLTLLLSLLVQLRAGGAL